MPAAKSQGPLPLVSLVTAVLVLRWSAAIAADDREREWPSPDHSAKVWSVAVGTESEPEFQLKLTTAGQTTTVIDDYLRSVDVSWSPDSKRVAVTDWFGSNVADCYVIDVAKPKRRFSMTSAIPKLREDILNSHYYVSCSDWLGSGQMAIRVAGHADYPPFHEFSYRFVYDVEAHRMN